MLVKMMPLARGVRAFSFGKGIAVSMPALSPTMTSGKIAKWNVKSGDKLTAGQAIAEIETDKVGKDAAVRLDREEGAPPPHRGAPWAGQFPWGR